MLVRMADNEAREGKQETDPKGSYMSWNSSPCHVAIVIYRGNN